MKIFGFKFKNLFKFIKDSIKDEYYEYIEKLFMKKLEKSLNTTLKSYDYAVPYIGNTRVSYFKISRYSLMQSLYLALYKTYTTYALNSISGISFKFDQSTNTLNLNIRTNRPGCLIGKEGGDIDNLKKYLIDILSFENIEITLEEVKVEDIFAWTNENY